MYEVFIIVLCMILISILTVIICYYQIFKGGADRNYDINIAYINSRLLSMFAEDQEYPYEPPPLPDGSPVYIEPKITISDLNLLN